MPTEKKILKDMEKEVVDQNREKPEIEEYEKVSGKKLDATNAPAIDAGEKLDKEWKDEEKEREIRETNEPQELTNEGMGIEKEEQKGEEAYPEIKKAIKEEADEEEESEEEEEEKEKEE